jgi:hypothetical protein
MVNALSHMLLNLVCHYLIEDFCINVDEADWPAVLFLDVFLSGFGMSLILVS